VRYRSVEAAAERVAPHVGDDELIDLADGTQAAWTTHPKV
jgi:hypothetical protein